MGQTVNLLTYVFGGSNPSSPTKQRKGNSPACEAGGDSTGPPPQTYFCLHKAERTKLQGAKRPGIFRYPRSFVRVPSYGKASRQASQSPGLTCGSSSVGRALAFQAKGREFEPRLPLHVAGKSAGPEIKNCCCSSVVEHFLGKEEVMSSILINSSKKSPIRENRNPQDFA